MMNIFTFHSPRALQKQNKKKFSYVVVVLCSKTASLSVGEEALT